jgi:hypothetical protein
MIEGPRRGGLGRVMNEDHLSVRTLKPSSFPHEWAMAEAAVMNIDPERDAILTQLTT